MKFKTIVTIIIILWVFIAILAVVYVNSENNSKIKEVAIYEDVEHYKIEKIDNVLKVTIYNKTTNVFPREVYEYYFEKDNMIKRVHTYYCKTIKDTEATYDSLILNKVHKTETVKVKDNSVSTEVVGENLITAETDLTKLTLDNLALVIDGGYKMAGFAKIVN